MCCSIAITSIEIRVIFFLLLLINKSLVLLYFPEFLDFHGKKRLEYALKSFCEGLSAYGLLTTMGNHPSVFRDLMCAVNDPLTPEKFLKLFTIVRSTPASNRFNLESDILQLFTDFLTDCHGNLSRNFLICYFSYRASVEEKCRA